VTFEREVWQCSRCRQSHAPVDRALGARSGAKWTRGVERKATCAAVLSPFADASQVLSELAGLEMGASEVDRIPQRHGEQIDGLQPAKEEEFLAPFDPLREPPEPGLRCARQVVEAFAAGGRGVRGARDKDHRAITGGGKKLLFSLHVYLS